MAGARRREDGHPPRRSTPVPACSKPGRGCHLFPSVSLIQMATPSRATARPRSEARPGPRSHSRAETTTGESTMPLPKEASQAHSETRRRAEAASSPSTITIMSMSERGPASPRAREPKRIRRVEEIFSARSFFELFRNPPFVFRHGSAPAGFRRGNRSTGEFPAPERLGYFFRHAPEASCTHQPAGALPIHSAAKVAWTLATWPGSMPRAAATSW